MIWLNGCQLERPYVEEVCQLFVTDCASPDVSNCFPVIGMGCLRNSQLHSKLVTPVPIHCGSVCCTVDFLQSSCHELHQMTFIVVPRSRATHRPAHDLHLYPCMLVNQFIETVMVHLTETITVGTAWWWCLMTESHARKHHSPASSSCICFQSVQYFWLWCIMKELSTVSGWDPIFSCVVKGK